MKKSPLATILLVVFVDLIGFGMIIPILPLYAKSFQAAEWQIGLLLGCYSFMQFLASPVLGYISDRVGRKPVLLVSLIGSAIGYAVMASAASLTMLFIARIIAGICGASVGTAAAYIADITPPENRSRRMGLIGAAFGVGFVLGPAIGGILSQFWTKGPFWFGAGLAFLNAIAVLLILPEPEKHVKRSEAGIPAGPDVVDQTGRAGIPVLVATYFVAIAGFAIVTMIYPQVLDRRFSLTPAQISLVFVFLGLVGAFIQGGAIGRMARRFGDYKLAAAGLLLMAISMVIMPFAHNIPLFLVFTFGLAAGNSLAQPTLMAMASRLAASTAQGRVIGTVQSAGSLGRVVGPSAGGFMLGWDRPGPDLAYGNTPFVIGGIVMGIAFLISLMLRRSPVSVTERPVEVAGK
ncbi:MAG: MFS transporter [Verrucomicrobia bacterium]|nr:MFS transporter [Verrucomicrobiota bacterium]